MAVVAVFGAALFAGCGGGDGDGATSVQTEAASSTPGESGQANEGPRGEASDDGGGAASGGNPEGAGGEFFAEADAACAQGVKSYQDEAERLFRQDVKSPAEKEQVITEIVSTVVIPRIEDQIGSLEALEGSPAEKEAADTVVDKLGQAIAAIEAEPEALVSGIVDEVSEAEQVARRLGFKRCGGLA